MVQKNIINNKIIIICGPTASGKSSLAISLAKALDTEIICADSMTIYKCLDIGTAKVTKAESQGVKHHLIDIVSPAENFTVDDYKRLARPIIDNLLINGKIPIVCGGTGFYINSILYDYSYGNSPANLDVRNKYFDLAKQNGNNYVYDILFKVDPESAKKLHPNDLKRVVRALEIYESGSLKSDIKDDLTPKYDYNAYMINFPRDILYDRINTRVDLLIKNGLIDEVKKLIDMNITLDNQCMQGIGYKEIYSYIKNEISLNESIELLKLNTRHYAKRQITFFKRLPNLVMLNHNEKENIERIIKDL